MDDKPPGIRRLCVGVDIEGCPGRSAAETQSVRQRLATALAEACSSSGLDRMLVNTQDTGEGKLALLPAGIDEPQAIASLVGGLCQALRRLNGPLEAGQRVRLRMAVHEGITILADTGFTGQAVAKTWRLLGSPPLQATLTSNPHADLAVLLSDQVLDDASRFGQPWLPAGQFRRVEMGDPADGSRDAGWIYVPGDGNP